MSKQTRVFISTPYSGTASQTQLYITTCLKYCNVLVARNEIPVAPVILAHYAHMESDDDVMTQQLYDQWLNFCLTHLHPTYVDRVDVLTHVNWDRSNGVSCEIRLAIEHLVPINYVTPEMVVSI